jgi:hypothetical protein
MITKASNKNAAAVELGRKRCKGATKKARSEPMKKIAKLPRKRLSAPAR